MGIGRSKVKIAIVDAGVNASAITSSDYIYGEIKNYNRSGGEFEVDTDPHFGGMVDVEKPRSQGELSFEITPNLDNPTRWEAIAYNEDSTNAGVYTMRGLPADKAVYIEASDSAGSKYQSVAFNNCNVSVMDMEHEADGNRSYSLTLRFSPETADGVSNFMASSTAVSSLPDWSTLDGN